MSSGISPPQTDPTPIFELYRGVFGSELLTAAVAHLRVFDCLAARPLSRQELAAAVKLAPRPLQVLTTALRAMELLTVDEQERFSLTPLAREHLVTGEEFDISGYLGLSADTPGVLTMVERLRANRPAGAATEGEEAGTGTAFIFREGETSAMEEAASARRLTLSLAGRARNVGPSLAEQLNLSKTRLLLDVGGGSGLYSIACLKQYPQLQAICWDRSAVLKVAEEMGAKYGVSDRLRCEPGDMFRDAVPSGADCILLSNILHDWDIPECRQLLARLVEALPRGGQLVIHDVFLNDELDGPLPIALYSVALFMLTEGRAYSTQEYRDWLEQLGLTVSEVQPTLVHCGLLIGTKP